MKKMHFLILSISFAAYGTTTPMLSFALKHDFYIDGNGTVTAIPTQTNHQGQEILTYQKPRIASPDQQDKTGFDFVERRTPPLSLRSSSSDISRCINEIYTIDRTWAVTTLQNSDEVKK